MTMITYHRSSSFAFCLSKDHIERDLSQVSHERHMLQSGIFNSGQTMVKHDRVAPPAASGSSQEGGGDRDRDAGGGAVEGRARGSAFRTASDTNRADTEAAFALEMQIQIKRAEREKKRQVYSLLQMVAAIGV